jgi:cytoskeletal protein CcmA (bactofilin family)
MFDKKTPKNYTELLGKTNRIVEATSIEGNIISQADFRLDGQLKGNFTSKGKLVIGPAGSVIGNITCVNLDVEGSFQGKIIVEETLSIKATARINGDVVCGKLSIEPGAEFNATCVMKTNQKSNEPEKLQEKQL